MKLFKTVDEKFQEIGFKKVSENEYGVEYNRVISEYNYTQVIYIGYKISGRHLIQSYEKSVNSDNYNNGVGITAYEAKLCIRKMREKGWRIHKK